MVRETRPTLSGQDGLEKTTGLFLLGLSFPRHEAMWLNENLEVRPHHTGICAVVGVDWLYKHPLLGAQKSLGQL